MSDQDPTGLWDHLDEMSDTDLAILVEVTGTVLANHAGNVDVGELRVTPLGPLAGQLATLATEEGFDLPSDKARMIGQDQDIGRQAAIAVLKSIDPSSELATEIADAYKIRHGMMIIPDPLTLSVLALFVLAIKLKRVKASKAGVDVQFNQVSSGALGFLRRLISI